MQRRPTKRRNFPAEAADLRGQIELMARVLDEQKLLRETAADVTIVDETVLVLEARIRELRANFRDKTLTLSKYTTSIKPDDAEMQITARRESEIFPKVPYYIPGTRETGEFWVEPHVRDNGSWSSIFASLTSNRARQTRSVRPSK